MATTVRSARFFRVMSTHIVFAILALLVTAPLAAGDEELVAIVEEVSGRVEVSLSGGRWAEVDAGDVLPIESRISTGFGARAVLAVGENALVTVQPLTRMRIDALARKDGIERSELTLEVGRIDGQVQRSMDRPTEFELRSPTATASVRGTDFSFDGERLRVPSGVVALIDRFGRQRTVANGEESSSTGGAAPENPGQNRSNRAITNPFTLGGSDKDDGVEPLPGGTIVVDDFVESSAIIIINLE